MRKSTPRSACTCPSSYSFFSPLAANTQPESPFGIVISSTSSGEFLTVGPCYAEPLGANLRVGQLDEQIMHSGAEAAKRRAFLLHVRFESRSMLGQLRVRQPGTPMVDAVIRL